MKTLTIVALLLLAGCTTPLTMMKNDTTGQVARCGGDATSSLAGGVIGYHVQLGNDAQCVKEYEAQGFKKL